MSASATITRMKDNRKRPGRPRGKGVPSSRAGDRHKGRKQMWIPVALYERLDRIAFHEQRPTSWQGEIAIAASVSEIEKAKGLPPIADDEAWREEKERRQREGR